MPEGPEIRQCADRIKRAIGGIQPHQVSFAFEHLKHYEPILEKKTVTQVKSRGKALLIFFDDDLIIYSHNQLYGKWYTKRAQNFPQTNRTLRLAIHTEKKSALLYSASDIEVLKKHELKTHPFLRNLGPDILDKETTYRLVLKRLKDKRFSGRQLGSLLLDQHFVAGLGNYLRCEVLFVTGLNPKLKPKQLSEQQLEALAKQIIFLTKQSYETKGITNDLGRVVLLKEKGYTRSQYRHHVFARNNRPCYACAGKVTKSVHASRPFFFCESCQPGCI